MRATTGIRAGKRYFRGSNGPYEFVIAYSTFGNNLPIPVRWEGVRPRAGGSGRRSPSGVTAFPNRIHSSLVPLDVLASARSTALIALVTASFSTPIVAKSDALASIGGGGREPVATEPLVAGGVEFDLPQAWGRLAPSAASSQADDRIGTVVSGLCPGGSAGAACEDGTQVTFIAYSGEQGHELPKLDAFAAQLDGKLAREFKGFRKVSAKQHAAKDGLHWLDYRFTWRSNGTDVEQRFAAYRHDDGSGVVAMVATDGADHAKALDNFLGSARSLIDAH